MILSSLQHPKSKDSNVAVWHNRENTLNCTGKGCVLQMGTPKTAGEENLLVNTPVSWQCRHGSGICRSAQDHNALRRGSCPTVFPPDREHMIRARHLSLYTEAQPQVRSTHNHLGRVLGVPLCFACVLCTFVAASSEAPGDRRIG